MQSKSFGLAVRALVTDDQGRILLIRRSNISRSFRHQWDLPGGKVDDGERFDEAALREVLEETGLEIALQGVAGAADYDMPDVCVATLFLFARHVAGEVRLSEEHDDFVWVPPSALRTMDVSDQLKDFLLRHIAT